MANWYSSSGCEGHGIKKKTSLGGGGFHMQSKRSQGFEAVDIKSGNDSQRCSGRLTLTGQQNLI